MARPKSVNEDDLIARLGGVFRDVGYEGASLAMLAEAAGLQKASLYHRFPGGKKQMADEVLAAAMVWFDANVLSLLNASGSPRDRLTATTKNLDGFYAGGRQACLLNMLSSPRVEEGPFSGAIKAGLEALVDGFAKLARDAGHPARLARQKAERALMLVQGSLVLSRGIGSGEPFRHALKSLFDDLLIA